MDHPGKASADKSALRVGALYIRGALIGGIAFARSFSLARALIFARVPARYSTSFFLLSALVHGSPRAHFLRRLMHYCARARGLNLAGVTLINAEPREPRVRGIKEPLPNGFLSRAARFSELKERVY